MSLKALSIAFTFQGCDSAAQKLALLALADHADDEGGRCYPSMRRLAAHTSLSEAQVRRHVHALIALGLVEVVGNSGGGGRGSTRRYRLNLHAMTTVDATPRADATPDTDSREGSHQRAEGLHRCTTTGGADATRTVIEPSEPLGTECAPHEFRFPLPGWWKSNRGIERAARQVGIDLAKIGTTGYPELKERIFERINLRRRAEGIR